MAAAVAEVHPPAKRKKQDTSCLETSPVFPATTSAGWSSLPDDLVSRIAESFLLTNDVDCYMDFRAVCASWRRATDDPKSNTSDCCFLPQTWIVLDEVFQSDDGRRILLNTATGRFLHKKLPQLLDNYVVATTTDGFFVLADRSPPHAARVLNPLTGYVVPFAAPVPLDVGLALVGSSDPESDKACSLSLLLLGDSSRKIYTALPHREGFLSQVCQQEVYNFLRKAVVGGAYTHMSAGLAFDGAFGELCDLLRYLHIDSAKFFSSDLPGGDANDIQYFLVGVDIHMLLVIKAHGTLFVFKMNNEIGKLEHVQSMANFAIFIGHHRCMPVDANEFPCIEANCVYYTEHLGSSAHICKYNIKDKKVERISEAPEFVKQDKKFVLVANRPFTIIQLLCSYAINIPDSQLALQQLS